MVTYPDPVAAAALAELAGAACIVVHLREDRRHIKDRDLTILRETVQTALNMEMAATEEMVGIACRIKPDCATLVPEKREELTTEGGLDVRGNCERVEAAVKALKGAGIKVSLFIDPDGEQIQASRDAGGDAIEIHTGLYCDARDRRSAGGRAGEGTSGGPRGTCPGPGGEGRTRPALR